MDTSACTLMQVSRRRLKDMRQTWRMTGRGQEVARLRFKFTLTMVAYALARLCIGASRLPAARRKTLLRRFASAADPQPPMPVLAAQARGLGEDRDRGGAGRAGLLAAQASRLEDAIGPPGPRGLSGQILKL
jgi:hypothetical protein